MNPKAGNVKRLPIKVMAKAESVYELTRVFWGELLFIYGLQELGGHRPWRAAVPQDSTAQSDVLLPDKILHLTI